MKRYFKILDTEETRDCFEGIIGNTYEMVGFELSCEERPELGGMYKLRVPGDGDLYFHPDEVEEIKLITLG